jgi:flagellar protein FlaG
LEAAGLIAVFSEKSVGGQSAPRKSSERAKMKSASQRTDRSKEEEKKLWETSCRLKGTRDLFGGTIHFEIAPGSRDVIAKVVDPETGKVIRQIPPRELVELAERIHKGCGVLLRTKI